MGENIITLEGFLSVVKSAQPITINLASKGLTEEDPNLPLITFILPGYDCLDDFLLDDEVTEIEIVNPKVINVIIDTSDN